jgi:predicted metalloprotease with PDZ domain
MSTHMTGSPLRALMMPGDEVVAINGMRTSTMKNLQTALKGKIGQKVEITYTHEGMLRTCSIELPEAPKHNVKLAGKGNKNWQNYIASRQDK